MQVRVHRHLSYQSESDQGNQAVMKRKPTITSWCGLHHRNTYADRNGKVHKWSSTAQMTICVYCGTPRWRYASSQELCEKCGRFRRGEPSRPETRFP
jgi:hypothetical protein